eukprot:gene7721-15800_t
MSSYGNFIIIESGAGLSNRLRTLATYLFLAKYYYNVSHIVMEWNKNLQCTGHFLEGFEPISNITFISHESREIFQPIAKHSLQNTNQPPIILLKSHGFPYSIPIRNSILYTSYSYILKPTSTIRKIFMDYILNHDICHSTAIHVRRTEYFENPSSLRNQTTDDDFFKFIDSLPQEEKIYLLTDNLKTQQLYTKLYPANKIIFYKQMNKGNENILRSSTFLHTVIDIWIAAHSQRFKGTTQSSLSDLVTYMRQLDIIKMNCNEIEKLNFATSNSNNHSYIPT